jgi:hypothetical protein
MVAKNVMKLFGKELQLTPKDIFLRSLIFSGLISICIAAIYYVTAILGGYQVYNDIVIGEITLRGLQKSPDITAYKIFIISFLLFFMLSWFFFRFTKKEEQAVAVKEQVGKGLILCFVLGLFSYTIKQNGLSAIGTFLLIAIICAIFILRINDLTAPHWKELSLSFYFIYLSCCGIFSLIKFLIPNSEGIDRLFFVFLFVSEIGLALYIYYSTLNTTDLDKRIYKYAIITWTSQILIPLGLFSLFNTRYFYHGELYKPTGLYKFKAILVLFTAICFIGNIFQLHQLKNRHKIKFVQLSSFFVLAILMTWNTEYNLVISTDPFHTGETAIVWDQVVSQKQRWGDEFVSVLQGLGFFYSMINKFIFSGTFSTYAFAQMFVQLITVISIIVGGFYLLKNKWLLLLIPLQIFLTSDRMYFVLPVILLLMNENILKRPVAWTYIYVGSCAFGIWYQPTYGGVVAVALLPILLLLWKRELKDNGFLRPRTACTKFKLTVFVSSLITIGMLCIPLLYQALRFVAENGKMTEVINGIPAFYSIRDFVPAFINIKIIDAILYFFSKFGIGLVFCIISIYFFFAYVIKENDDIKKIRGIILSVSCPLIFLLLLPAIFVRIDPNSPSRIGNFSISFCSVSLLLFIYFYYQHLNFKSTALIFSGVIIFVLFYNTPQQIFSLHNKINKTIEIPNNAYYFSKEDTGLNKMGNVFTYDEYYIKEARVLRDLCDKVLGFNQTYYDFTDKSIYYLYAERKVPGIYVAPMIAANTPIQRRVLAQLGKNDIPIIFINNPLSLLGPLSLRSYFIYRYFLLQDYLYINYKGFDFLVRSDVDLTYVLKDISVDRMVFKYLPDLDPDQFLSKRLTRDQLTMENITYKNNIEVNSDLALIRGGDPFYILPLDDNKNISMSDIKVIEIVFKEEPIPGQTGQLFIQTDKYNWQEEYSIFFRSSDRVFLPVYQYDHLVKGETILKALRLDFDGLQNGDNASIKEINIYTFKDHEWQDLIIKIEEQWFLNQKISSEITEIVLNNIFKPVNLEFIPNEWGRNYKRLSKMFENKCIFEMTGDVEQIVFTPDRPVTGEDVEFIHLFFDNTSDIKASDVLFNKTNLKNISIKIDGIDRNGNIFNEQFVMKMGKELLIPIGSSPKCLRAKNINSVTIFRENFPRLDIQNIEALHLID